MAHPYRTKLSPPAGRRTDERRLSGATLIFASLSVVVGLSLTGEDREECTLLATFGGFALLLSRPRAS